MNKRLDRFFKLTERGTNVKTEVIAGATIFMTMAFLIAVHPNIMAAAGMDRNAMVTVTIVTTILFSVICGLYCNIPFILATALGSNAMLAYSIVGSGIADWQTALGMNFISGVIFVIISICGAREMVVKAIPKNLKVTMGCTVGIFITATGMSNVKLIEITDAGFLALGNLQSKEILLLAITLLMIISFGARGIGAGLLVSMIIGTIIGIPLGITTVPDAFVSMPPSMSPVMFKVDIVGALDILFLPFVLTFFIGDFFSTVGNLFGIGAQANLLDENGNYPQIKKPFLVDSIATCIGTVMGTNTVTIYSQSAAGVTAGGRTGLTAIAYSFFMFLALFLTPVALMVPTPVSSAALIVIGLEMLKGLAKLDFDDYTEYLPAFIALVGTAYTYNIATGLSLGIVSCVIINIAAGKWKKLHPIVYIIAVPLFYYLLKLA